MKQLILKQLKIKKHGFTADYTLLMTIVMNHIVSKGRMVECSCEEVWCPYICMYVYNVCVSGISNILCIL